MSLLILGATGTLGRQIVRKALNEGFQVKCFVRNFRKAAFLKEWGAELVYGDLKIPETIPLTLNGITAIIDASTARPYDLSYAKRIDLYGKYILIESARKAKIKKYIFFSILNAKQYGNIPLMSWKLSIEKQLTQSNINYTIFNLSGFFQGLISQYALPVLDQKSVWITGEKTLMAYINTEDIAKVVVKSLSIKQSKKKTFPLVGVKSWTSLDIINLCEKISGQKAKITKVPIVILKVSRQFMSIFQWTWNIAGRLAFTEVLAKETNFYVPMNKVYDIFELNIQEFETLENYFQEYFKKIMYKLKEVNYQVITENQKNNNTDF
uniref:NmrA-like domain-containing protein n=1 Tax=Crouania attenuata TaxID=42002 RepID=A0A4D6WP61_9FLOR|nr:hypothetical protein [Crouania attenuata]